MELTTTGINKTQAKLVVKVQAMLNKFFVTFERNKKERPEKVALPHQTYQDIMAYYANRPDSLTYLGVLVYDCNNPPEAPPPMETKTCS